jgi:tRNA pseudouridine55 synthase
MSSPPAVVEKPRTPCGVLVVDKPSGCTSHDVVSWARRAFSTREVGHAGTLDPMATGVLVLLLGEATKLSSWVTAEDKAYDASVRFHVETDSLDADGAIVREVDAPAPEFESVLREARAMLGACEQVPPSVSAVKVDGVAAHERARRGEQVALAAREVNLRAVDVRAVRGTVAEVSLEASKGFYVRSFARDLAARLGTVAHLTALRRTRSGVFTLLEAVAGEALRAARSDADARAGVHARLQPLRALEGRMPSARLSAEEAARILQGKTVTAREQGPLGTVLLFADRAVRGLPPQPIGLAEHRDGVLVARRNLAPPALSDAWQPWLDGPAPG